MVMVMIVEVVLFCINLAHTKVDTVYHTRTPPLTHIHRRCTHKFLALPISSGSRRVVSSTKG